MKKRLLIALVCTLSVNQAKSQFVNWEKTGSTWSYDFSGAREEGLSPSLSGGPDIGAYTNTSTIGTPGWLPAPASGKAFIKTHADVTYNGGYDLLPEDSPNSLRVRITKGGVTKFSLYDAGGATEIARFATTIKFGPNGTAGLLRLALGNTGASAGVFTSGSNISNTAAQADVFAVLGLSYTATGINLIGRKNPTGSSTSGIIYSSIKETAFSLGESYELEVFMNNSSTIQKYTYGINSININPRTYHLWIDGIQLAVSDEVSFPTAIAGVPELAVNKPINAFGITHLSGADFQEAAVTFSNIRFDYAETTLPVSLTSFTAEKQNDAVKLNWSTASEQNNSHFDVLRSSNGKEFYPITQVSGAGNSNEIRHYSYTDNTPFSGVNYYKLKQVDFNGASAESEVQVLSINQEREQLLTVYQNGNSLIASIYSPFVTNGNIRLTDISGKIFLEKKVVMQAGYTRVDIGNRNLKSGIYIANIIVEGKSQSVKFLYEQ